MDRAGGDNWVWSGWLLAASVCLAGCAEPGETVAPPGERALAAPVVVTNLIASPAGFEQSVGSVIPALFPGDVEAAVPIAPREGNGPLKTLFRSRASGPSLGLFEDVGDVAPPDKLPRRAPLLGRFELPDFPEPGASELYSDRRPRAEFEPKPAVEQPTLAPYEPPAARSEDVVRELHPPEQPAFTPAPSWNADALDERYALPLEDEPAAAGATLPATTGPVVRSPQMELVARQADADTRRGFRLAEHRAYYSARGEFIGALRRLTQALDVQHGESSFSAALAAGLRALDEADDFAPRGSRLEADMKLAHVVASHRTPVLKGADLSVLAPLAARQSYYTYAREQLGVCAGDEVAGSMALYGLARVHAAMGRSDPARAELADAKAIVFDQAALLVEPRNYLAANDLGVLLARAGLTTAAVRYFEQSLSIAPQATTWRNLAAVHRMAGDQPLAERADLAALALEQQHRVAGGMTSSAASAVEWVPPDELARSSNDLFFAPAGAGQEDRNSASPNATEANAAAEAAPSAHWNPWKR